MTMPIVWSIAGSDPSGCAGIQTDLKTFHALGIHGCSIITAITAQSVDDHKNFIAIEASQIENQLAILATSLQANIIKIGMLGDAATISMLTNSIYLKDKFIILDPILYSSTHQALFNGELADYLPVLKRLLTHITLLTPNIPEAELILNRRISSYSDMQDAAQDFLAMGIKNVFLKGGHFDDNQFSQDYFLNENQSCWLASPRQAYKKIRGTGCALSSAIAAALALGYTILDAVVIAKMYVNQSIRLAKFTDSSTAILQHLAWPEDQKDLPYLSHKFISHSPFAFPEIQSIGLYPIVDDVSWIKKLAKLNVKTIQLRIKNKNKSELNQQIQQAVHDANMYGVQLFINDYWQQAIQFGAYGVHLGQEDLVTADLAAIREAGLRLGISTHCYYEVARAHFVNPSYLACGPIFPTTSKIMPFKPQGLQQLSRWRQTLTYPLVAIGGINQSQFAEVVATKVEGIAMISAIIEAHELQTEVNEFNCKINQIGNYNSLT